MFRTMSNILLVFLCCAVAIASDTVTMKDGTNHVGRLVSATSTTITFKEGRKIHRYRRADVQSIEFGTPATSAAPARTTNAAGRAAPAARTVVLPAGTEIAVLTNENIDSKNASPGRTFSADVASNVTSTRK